MKSLQVTNRCILYIYIHTPTQTHVYRYVSLIMGYVFRPRSGTEEISEVQAIN